MSRDTNLPLIEFVEARLKDAGVAPIRIRSETQPKSNLFATIGPQAPGGVVLSGHTDVVPTDGQAWSSDPFALRAEGGRLYGRGATDMKSFIAIALALVPEMVEAELKRPIHLAFSFDEEVGCLGAPLMIRHIAASAPKPAAVIVGEPTGMEVVTSHKGVVALTTRVRGKAVHSSVVNHGVSAVAYAARLAVWLDERMRGLAETGPTDARFDPPYTSLHSGIIVGGEALNITAGEATLTSDIRALPGDDPEAHVAAFRREAERLAAEMRMVDPACGVEIEIKANVPPCAREENGAAEALARRLSAGGGGGAARDVVAFGTEAGQFQDAGFSTVVCGPGDMEQGHIADEFIEIDQLRAGEAFQRRLIAELRS